MSKFYVADFETTNEEFYKKNGYTKVWLYGICDNDCNIIGFGTSIEDFIVDIRKLVGKKIYFHNLKFDGTFIVDYLMKNGFEYKEDLKNENKGFTLLIGDTGQWYSMIIKFSKGRQITLLDSLKLLPFKVSNIAKSFNLPIMKEVIDYGTYEVNPMTIMYQLHDVKIVAMALNAIKEEGMTKMTTASCAYNNYKDMNTQEWFDYHFPMLSNDFLIEYRQAYRGGRCQVNPLYQGKILKNVKRYDINSMYPYIMYDKLLPTGKPIKCTIANSYKFELYKIQIEFSLKDDCLPSLLKKGSLFITNDTYYIETEGIETMWISNIDLALVFRNYNVHYLKYIDIYGFDTTRILFRKYIDLWYGRKLKDKGAKKIVDKLMLNSLYGKFGSNPIGSHKIPVLSNDMVVYVNSIAEELKKYYLPMAIGITSHAHMKIDDGIHETKVENFVYVDTDSIHTLGTLNDSEIDQTKLGYYKLEGIEKVSKYVRQKTYVYKQDNEIIITCAGMNEELKRKAIETYGDNIFKVFKVGFNIGGKLMPKRVNGGTILYETTFEIK